MPQISKYLSTDDLNTIATVLRQRGVPEDQIGKVGATAANQLVEQRKSQEFGQMSTAGQGWWAAKRGFKGVGEVFTGALAGLFGYGRPLGEIYKTATEEPFQDVPSGVREDAPATAKVIFPMAGTLLRDIPLMGGMSSILMKAPVVSAIATLPHGALPMRVATGATAFGALGPIQEQPFGERFLQGAAMSVPPAVLGRYVPQLMPKGIPGAKSWPGLAQAGVLAPSAVAGMTGLDLIRGHSLAEQFDPRTPEGVQSLIDKGVAFGFTALHSAQQSKKVLAAVEKNRSEFMKKFPLREARAAELTAEVQKKLYSRPMTLEDKVAQLRAMEDPAIQQMATDQAIEVKAEWLSPKERADTALHRSRKEAIAYLDLNEGPREMFTPEGRESVIAAVNEKLGQVTVGQFHESIWRKQARDKQTFELMKTAVDRFANTTEQKQDAAQLRGAYYFGKEKAPQEGIFTGPTGKLEYKPVVTQMAPDLLRRWFGRQRQKLARVMEAQFPELGLNGDREVANVLYASLIEELGPKEAGYLWNLLSKGSGGQGVSLSTSLTSDKYARVARTFEGKAIELLENTAAAFQSKTGQVVDVYDLEKALFGQEMPWQQRRHLRDAVDVSVLHKFRQTLPRLLQYEERTGVPTGEAAARMAESKVKQQDIAGQAQAGISWAWSEGLPQSIFYDPRWQPLKDFVWLRTEPTAAQTMGIKPRSIEEVAAALGKLWKGTPRELELQAIKTARRMKTVLRWGFMKTGMSYDKMREFYLPHYFEWKQGRYKGSLQDFLVKKGATVAEAKTATASLRQVVELPQRQFVPKGGEAFYERPRKDVEKDAVEYLTLEKDPIMAMTKYFGAMVRRTYLDPHLPFLSRVTGELRDFTAGIPGKGARVMTSFSDAVKAWYGISPSFDQYLQGWHPIAKGIEEMRNWVPGGKKILPEVTPDNYRYRNKLIDFITTGAYAATLAYKPMPVIKNLTQSSHEAILRGPVRWFSNLLRYVADTKFRAECDAMYPKIRYQYMEMSDLGKSAVERAMTEFADMGLGLFQFADHFNVMGSIASSVRMWQQAKSAIGSNYQDKNKMEFQKGLELQKVRWMKMLWDRFRGLPGVQRQYKKAFPGAQTLGDIIWRNLQKGNEEGAKVLYTQFMAYLTQFAYGGMHGPPIYRGSAARLFGMYTSYPVNYAEFLYKLAKMGPGREWLRLAATWASFFGLYRLMKDTTVGKKLKVYDWFGFGAFPLEMGLQSPPLKAAANAYTALNTLGRASQGWLAGAEDDYYLLHYQDRLAQALETAEDLIPGRGLYQSLAEQ